MARKEDSGLSLEKGAVRKNWGGRFPVALGYPNSYALALSNLGFQTIYHLLNRDPRVVAERFYLPEKLTARSQSEASPALLTQESRRPVAETGVIIFSISFERDYLNLVTLLERAGLAPRAKDRTEDQPLVLVGGVTTFINPLPLFPLVDGFLLGEGESQIPLLIDVLIEHQDQNRQNLLEKLVQVPGFLLAEFPVRQNMTLPRAEVNDFVPRTFIAGAGTQVFADTLLVEVNRGCPRGCRFCAAGFVYRPFRNRSLDCVKQAIRDGAELGLKKVGLVGSALGDYPDLTSLCSWLVEEGFLFSFSSLRIDTIDDRLLELLQDGGVKSITIAPEAGSERLRRAIRKGLSEEVILAQAARMAAAGIGRLKLYFLIGLPLETQADIEAIVELVKEIKKVMLAARSRPQLNIALNVSINPFVPKPHTPMQWAPFAPINELKKKLKFLGRELRRPGGIEIEMESPVNAAWQALLSRGGPELAPILIDLAAHSCGQTSYLKKIFAKNSEKLAALDSASPLPWDFISQATSPDYLLREYHNYLTASNAGITPATQK
ncbi:MAG: radical SAM protein [Deltaproteobacteria bacterium]|nr:radical SAM protein [Candidatus Tharpella aukensis]